MVDPPVGDAHPAANDEGTHSFSFDLNSIDLVPWLFMHGVMVGDISKKSPFYQVVACTVLTAYGFRGERESWEQFESLYLLVESLMHRNGDSSVDLLRGPGRYGKKNDFFSAGSPKAFFSSFNFFLPHPDTIRANAPAAASSDGLYAADVLNYALDASQKTKCIIKSENVATMPTIMATDGIRW
jgi:hypothetical protein